MPKVQELINEYKELSQQLTNKGDGLKSLKDQAVILGYIDDFDEISENLRVKHESFYKIDESKQETVMNGSNPAKLTIPEMIHNREYMDDIINKSYDQVKLRASKTVSDFKVSLTWTENNIKDIVERAAEVYYKKGLFLDAEATLLSAGEASAPPANVTITGSNLTWEPVENATSYIVTWTSKTVSPRSLEANQIEITDLTVDIAAEMQKKGELPGDYLISVAAKFADGTITDASAGIEYTLEEYATKLEITRVKTVDIDGGTGSEPNVSNVGKYSAELTGSNGAYTIAMTVNEPLVEHTSTQEGMGTKKWMGVVISTDQTIADGIEMKTGAGYTLLEETESTDATAQGVADSKSFLFWFDDSDPEINLAFRRKDKPESESTITIDIAPYTPSVE